MTYSKNIQDAIFNLIKNHQENFSFQNLENVTDLSFEDLSVIIGSLILDNRIRLHINLQSVEKPVIMTRNEQLYVKFMDLLTFHYQQERSVSFYASKLCISSKYLASVIKNVSGKKPRELIKEKILDKIKYMLCYTQLSIKEIAYELNFPNASFLGKYFKAETGVSPSRYREIHCNCVKCIK